jgi:hypothetical protein
VTRAAPLYPETAKRHRVYRGLTERQERLFSWIASIVVLLFVTGYVGAIVTTKEIEERRDARLGQPADVPPPTPARRIVTSLTDSNAPKTPYLNEALLQALEGESGELRFATATPGTTVATGVVAPANPGVYKLASQINAAASSLTNFNLISLVPLSRKEQGRIGSYRLGSWPYEKGGKPKSPQYAAPSGFIEVTKENQDTYVSEHFRLRDFLTKDQFNVWPKYLPLNPKVIDKLELTIQELEATGIKVEHMQVMSGFRTPNYNERGGNTAGRANLSRHMYGDAADVFVDNDRNGTMDDISGDGRVDTKDADVIAQAAERVERKHPSLVGGIGVYKACCGHGPFTHVDVRGFRARWRE